MGEIMNFLRKKPDILLMMVIFKITGNLSIIQSFPDWKKKLEVFILYQMILPEVGMIISASRRTDIPAFYSDWFFHRIRKGYLKTRNPYNPKQIRKISLLPDDVDCIVFWTKDPGKILQKLKLLQDYFYYFLYTLNSYGTDIEPLPLSYQDRILNFKRLSEMIGPEKVIWRYDPILISPQYSLDFHLKAFERSVNLLNTYTKTCIISFIDFYRNKKLKLQQQKISKPDFSQQMILLAKFQQIASSFNLKIQTCAEKGDFQSLNIYPGKCIDDELISRITGKNLTYRKDKGQRKQCLCQQSIDIGSYNTCLHNCGYCYANNLGISLSQNHSKQKVNPNNAVDIFLNNSNKP